MDWLSLHFVDQISAIPGALAEYQFNPLLTVLAYVLASITAFATQTLHGRITASLRSRRRRIWSLATVLCLGGGLWAVDRVALLSLQAPVSIDYETHRLLLALAAYLLTASAFVRLLRQPEGSAGTPWAAVLVAGLGVPFSHYLAMMSLHSSAIVFYEPAPFVMSFLAGLIAAGLAVRLRLQFHHQNRSSYILLKYALSLLTGLTIFGMFWLAMHSMQLLVPSGVDAGLPSPVEAVQDGLVIGLVAMLVLGTAVGAAYADAMFIDKEQDLIRVNSLLSQLDRARDSLQQLANYDHLTDLLNRRSFTEQFNGRLNLPEHREQLMALLFLDVDHFKRVNDSLGHEAGDEVLRIIARRIRAVLRSQQDRRGDDLIARFGGDEFCMLLPINVAVEAPQVCQRLLQKLREPIAVAGRSVVMTASVGISFYPTDSTESEDLMKHAELALYQAKQNGRNTVQQFSRQMHTQAGDELLIEADLRQALADNSLDIHYQPVTDLHTGQVVQVEALLRWQHNTHGRLLPEYFVAVAEAHGFVDELDAWAFARACRDLKELHARGWTDLRVAVNCSALNLGDEKLVETCRQTLAQAGLAAHYIELELTENALMTNLGKAAAQLTRLRELGMGISIDDFGTGYSSLSYLKSLPISTLKVDRSFIQDIPANANDTEITGAIIAMAHKLRLKVIAEGAETEHHLQFLRDNGCDMVQGFHISEPLPLAALQDFLAKQQPSGAPQPA